MEPVKDHNRKLRHNVALHYCHFVDDADADEFRVWNFGVGVKHLEGVYYPCHAADFDVQPVFDVDFVGEEEEQDKPSRHRQQPCVPYQWTKRYLGSVKDAANLPAVLEALEDQIRADDLEVRRGMTKIMYG